MDRGPVYRGPAQISIAHSKRRLVFVYKIVNNIAPAYTRNPIQDLHELAHSFRARAAIGQIKYMKEQTNCNPNVCQNGKTLIQKYVLITVNPRV